MASADVAKLLAVLELKDLFSDKINKAERNLTRFESRSTKAGRQIGLGILRGAAIAATGVTAAVGLMGKAVFAASNLNETVSKTGIVFGKNAAEVLAFGKTSAAALGLSEQAADEAAATYGNLFVSMGLASGKSADMSIKLVKLAGDLASFNNIDPTEALDKLRAGLTGESEPLKTLGININETILKAKAMELGLVKSVGSAELAKAKRLDLAAATAKVTEATKKYGAGSSQALKAQAAEEKALAKLKDTTAKMPGVLDPAIKAQAAYALIMEQSGTAQGDFARTSDGLANQIRILKANFTDMLATLGTPVLPQVAKVFKQINVAIKENQPEIAKLGDAVAALFSDANIKNGADILKGAFETAKETAPIIAASAKATFGLVQGAVSLFKSLPPELQKLAVGAFAVNKLTGGLVTNIAGGIIDAVGKNFLQRGGTPANPLFVADVTGGKAGLAGAGAVTGKGGAIGKLASVASKVFIIGAVAGLFAELAGILDEQTARNKTQTEGLATQVKTFASGASLADLKSSLAGVDARIAALNADIGPTGIAFGLNIDGVRDAVYKTRADLVTAIKAQGGQTGLFGKLGDTLKTGLTAVGVGLKAATGDLDGAGFRHVVDASTDAAEKTRSAIYGSGGLQSAKITHAVSALGQKFGADIKSLRAATKPFDVAKFARAIAADVQKGSGSVKGTQGVLKDLRIKLAETHDPKLQAVLRAAIASVGAKLPNRQWVDRELALGKKIAGSTDTATKRIADLKVLEASLRAHGDRHAANTIHKLEANITATKGVKTAAQGTTAAVKAKDLSVKLTVPISVSVSNGSIRRAATTYTAVWGGHGI